MVHKSVLKKETIDLLKIKSTGTYIDLTLGGGGHSLEIAKDLKEGTLICFDVDKLAIENFESIIKKQFKSIEIQKDSEVVKQYVVENKKIVLVNQNFENIKEVLANLKVRDVDGVLADLGWSSDQLNSVAGLSFEKIEEKLDMRLDKTLGVKASDLLNALGKKQLSKLFEEYADIKSKLNTTLVDEILKFREQQLFQKVSDLLQVIEESIWKSRIDVGNEMQLKARVFQALRIAVNNELVSLNNMLTNAYEILSKNGVLLVITFHSGEERRVAQFFEEKVKEGAEYISNQRGHNYLQASVEELMENLSSRSAKLFGLKK